MDELMDGLVGEWREKWADWWVWMDEGSEKRHTQEHNLSPRLSSWIFLVT
jgi:hypothetical protein